MLWSDRYLSSIFFSIIISSSNLFKRSPISRGKNKLYITSHHVSGLCLTELYIMYISIQKVDLHNLLDLVCPSVSQIFKSIFKFGWLAYHLWRNFKPGGTASTVNDNKLHVKDNAIRIYYLKYMYFKISIQIKSRISNRTSDYLSPTQLECQCVVYKIKQRYNKTRT